MSRTFGAGGAPVKDVPAPPARTRKPNRDTLLARPHPRVSEREFSDRVVELARWFGWTAAHFGAAQTAKGWRTPVRYDGKGFPDLVLVHPERRLVWFRELKAGRRPLDDEQLVWAEWLNGAGANWDVWRPADWPDIVAALSNGRAEVML